MGVIENLVDSKAIHAETELELTKNNKSVQVRVTKIDSEPFSIIGETLLKGDMMQVYPSAAKITKVDGMLVERIIELYKT